MNKILTMQKRELLLLTEMDMPQTISVEEMLHIGKTLGAFWAYDYEAAKRLYSGMHAILKSGLHSDGFFVSRILLEPENIRRLISQQMIKRLREANVPNPDYIAGIPNGATALGSNIAKILGIREACIEKVDGRITLKTNIPSKKTLLLVEDFCTRGTGFKETVLQIKTEQPTVRILPYNPVIINRGGLREIIFEGDSNFTILSVAELRIQNWEPTECPLCFAGSKAIKPKATNENWRLLTTSQQF